MSCCETVHHVIPEYRYFESIHLACLRSVWTSVRRRVLPNIKRPSNIPRSNRVSIDCAVDESEYAYPVNRYALPRGLFQDKKAYWILSWWLERGHYAGLWDFNHGFTDRIQAVQHRNPLVKSLVVVGKFWVSYLGKLLKERSFSSDNIIFSRERDRKRSIS